MFNSRLRWSRHSES